MMPKIKVIVGSSGGKPVLVIDEETNRLLLFTVTYNKRIKSGEYLNPRDVVEILKEIATRGHDVKSDYNPELIYKFLEPLLLSEAPLKDKFVQVMKYIRSAIKD